MNPLQSVLVSMDVLLIGSERAETFSKRKVLRPLPLPKISGKGERKARRSFARGVANRDYVTQTWPARAPVIRFLSALWGMGTRRGRNVAWLSISDELLGKLFAAAWAGPLPRSSVVAAVVAEKE
jgi:hypothetical protein